MDRPGGGIEEEFKQNSKTEEQTTKQNSNLKFNLLFSGGTRRERMPHVRTRTLPMCASYLNTTVCMLVHIHTHLYWLQMQYILLLLSKTLITLHSLISHKYSEGRAVIRAYIYPTWLGENPVQCWPQGWASPTRLRCHGWNQDTSGHTVCPSSGAGSSEEMGGGGACRFISCPNTTDQPTVHSGVPPQLVKLKKFISCSNSQQSVNTSGRVEQISWYRNLHFFFKLYISKQLTTT